MRQFQTVFVFWLDPWKRWKLFLFYEKSKIRSHKSILFNLPEIHSPPWLEPIFASLHQQQYLFAWAKFHSRFVGCWLIFAMSLVLISQSPFSFFPSLLCLPTLQIFYISSLLCIGQTIHRSALSAKIKMVFDPHESCSIVHCRPTFKKLNKSLNVKLHSIVQGGFFDWSRPQKCWGWQNPYQKVKVRVKTSHLAVG